MLQTFLIGSLLLIVVAGSALPPSKKGPGLFSNIITFDSLTSDF